MIDKIITNIIEQEAPDQTVAVLMSGGTDSLTVAIAAHRLNKTLNCYTFRVDGKDSEDSIYAKKACEHFGWNFKLIDVPVDNIENDFFTLIKKYECKKKTHVECTFPFLYVYPHIKEKYISSLQHAGDMGIELCKAELALKYNLNYVQDKDLYFK